jgi:hypothetical protein
LRTKWASEHFHVLEREIDAWPVEANANALVQHFDPDTSTIVICVGATPSYPVRWARLASEAAFNLRAALDYTVWELSKWNLKLNGDTREPFDHTQFPISTKPGVWRGDQVPDLHANHVALIKWLQPNAEHNVLRARQNFEEFARAFLPEGTSWVGNSPEVLTGLASRGHPLGRLVAINDHDKHRTLRPVATIPALIQFGPSIALDCELTGMWNSSFVGQYHVGAKIAEVGVRNPGSNPEVMVNNWITPRVAFGEDDILSDIPWIYNCVRGILELFWPVFL